MLTAYSTGNERLERSLWTETFMLFRYCKVLLDIYDSHYQDDHHVPWILSISPQNENAIAGPPKTPPVYKFISHE